MIRIASLSLIALVVAGAANAAQHVSTEIENNLRAAYSGTQIDAIQPSEIPGLYELHMGKNIAYSSAAGRYLVVGHIYDTKTGKDLTQGRIDALGLNDPRVNWQDMPLADAIRTGQGSTKKIAVFTDPQCSFCVKLEKELAMLDDIERYTFLYPIRELHPQAVDIAKDIWCAKRDDAGKLHALRDFMINSKKPPKSNCDTAALKRIAAYADKQSFMGTPTIVRGDGAVLFGYRDINQLRAWLSGGVAKNAGKMP